MMHKSASRRLQNLSGQLLAWDGTAATATPKNAESPAAAAGAVKHEERFIPLLDATPENFAPFGSILGADPAPVDGTAGRYASLRISNPKPNFVSDDDTHMIVLSYEPRPLECEFLERHYKHTQVFIPLAGKPLVGFFAPPNDKDEPDLSKVVALRFDGTAGFIMHKGTWHEQPNPIEPHTNAICILRNETMRELKPMSGTKECHGQDIDKLDLKERYNFVFTTRANK